MEPQVLIEPAAVLPAQQDHRWLVAWQITNQGDRLLELEAAWLPHDHFYAEEQQFDPAAVLAPGASTRLEREVFYDEQPGAEVENAFLILRARWGDVPWRILNRLRIVADERGTPRVIGERLSVQPIGFAR